MAGLRYARDAVAYEVRGDAGPTIVANWGWFSNIEAFHEIPGYTGFVDELASFARVVTFDVRGMGASRGALGTFANRVDDLGAVVDELGSASVFVLGASSAGALALSYAATHPDRVAGLLLWGTYPRLRSSDELFYMAQPDLIDRVRRGLRVWGNGGSAAPLAPSLAASRNGRELWKRLELACIDAAGAVRSFDVDATIDVVDQLGAVTAPALVMHRVNEQFVPPYAARFIAGRLPHATLVYLDGLDHYPWLANAAPALDAIRNFVTGNPQRPPPLKGVLLTDIVRSTQHLLTLGEARWGQVLETHADLATTHVTACDGQLVKSTGDGIVAMFNGPADALRCAVALRDALRTLDLEVRFGVTVGDVVSHGRDVTGVSIHMAERIAKLADAGQILVSRGVTVMLSETRFSWLGTRSFRGIPADRSVFELA